jgi:hypothetical protein
LLVLGAISFEFDCLELPIGGGDDLFSFSRYPDMEWFAAAFAAFCFPGESEFWNT